MVLTGRCTRHSKDLFAMQGLPNMSVVVPCDAVETQATSCLLLAA